MEHRNLENVFPSALKLHVQGDKEKFVIVLPHHKGVGKILIEEGCKKARNTCSGVKNQWSLLCWQSDKKYYTLLFLLSATFVLSLIAPVFLLCQSDQNSATLSDMVLRNNSKAYSLWKKPDVQALMKVHIFNYTNWRRYKDGYDAKLHVEDVGPYVYSQQLERENVEFAGDTITFQERSVFRFLANESVGSQFDKVTVPNILLLGFSKMMSKNFFMRHSVMAAMPLLDHQTAFIQLPVHKFLWGYEDEIFNAAKPFMNLHGNLKIDQFGLLAVNNNTLTDQMTINTGEIDIDKLSVIEKVEGKTHLDLWSSPYCNSIEATDGSIFPPSQLDRQRPLFVFYRNLCRRLPFVYDKDIEVDNIPLIRYRLAKNVLDVPQHNAENQCYCDIDSGACPPQGVINVTTCASGTPILVSFPHFYGGDPRLRESITGLQPDPNMHHNYYLDVHPTLGIVLAGKASLQINMQVMKTDGLSSLSFLDQDMILPIAWIETSLEELPESIHTLINNGTSSTSAVNQGLVATSITTLLISGICVSVLLIIGRRQKKPCATMKISTESRLRNQVS